MSKPKPTPAEKTTLEIIRAEMRSVSDQIRTMESLTKDAAHLYDRLSFQLSYLRDQQKDMKQRAKSITR